MAGKSALEELELAETGGPAGRNGPAGESGGDDSHGAAPAFPQQRYVTGIWLALASILMFFMALTSSFVVRKGLGSDWAPFELPPLLWFNTAVLLMSSVTLEAARRALSRGQHYTFHRWWNVTTALGILFLVGQVAAWLQLRAAGVYLASNPSSSFFYVLTATHAAHLLGGVCALLYVGGRSRRLKPWPIARTAATATAIYWHFLGGLWVFLFLLLLLGR